MKPDFKWGRLNLPAYTLISVARIQKDSKYNQIKANGANERNGAILSIVKLYKCIKFQNYYCYPYFRRCILTTSRKNRKWQNF
jgi:hypothetical protein